MSSHPGTSGNRGQDRLVSLPGRRGQEDGTDLVPAGFHPAVELENLTLEQVLGTPRYIALYVHVPFCLRKCIFCSSLVVAGRAVSEDLIRQYLAALHQEIRLYGQLCREQRIKVKTIHFGGGTPSLLAPSQLEGILEQVKEHFDCRAMTEVVVEVFPTSLTREIVRLLEQVGCAKINIGVQAFDDRLLAAVGRPHTADEAVRAIELARRAQLASVGIDLITGLPGSNPRTTIHDINLAVRLGVDHFAIYPLWLYPGTVLFHRVRRGEMYLASYEERRECLASAHEALRSAGYRRYTVFHQSLSPENEHLYGKWQMEDQDWMGLGVGSVSNMFGAVFQNARNIRRYIDRASSGNDCVELGRVLTTRERMHRTLAYGLRLVEFDARFFREKYGCGVDTVFNKQLDFLEGEGLLERQGARLRLTVDGVMKLRAVEETIMSEVT